jgi:lipopolysaccharide transport system permease protein
MAIPLNRESADLFVTVNDATENTTGIIGPLRRAVSEVVGARYLLFQLTSRDVRIRYKQAAMGLAWAMFMPVLVVLAGAVVRAAMARMSGTDLDVRDLGSVAVKGLPWTFFVGAIGFATSSLTANLNLVSKVAFPREVLPLASVGAQLFDTTIAATVVGLLLPFLGAKLSFALFWVPLLVLLLLVFTIALALLLSSANLFFRDVKYIVQVVLTFGVFFTPVFYDAAALGPRWSKVIMLNPLSIVLEGLRLSLFAGHNLAQPRTEVVGRFPVLAWSPTLFLAAAIGSTLLLVFASVVFERSQHLFAERI